MYKRQLRAQDEVRDVLHETRFAAQHDDLKAMVRVEMHVHGRDDGFEVIVLDSVQLLLQVAGVMVEDDGQRAHHLHARRGALAVSYTHLDVYKRQMPFSAWNLSAIQSMMRWSQSSPPRWLSPAVDAVSYTHLPPRRRCG